MAITDAKRRPNVPREPLSESQNSATIYPGTMNYMNYINCHRVLLTVSLEDVSWISWIPPHFKGRISQLLRTQPDAFDAVDALQALQAVYLVHWMVKVSKMNKISN